jgi:hypothetical protein
MDDVLAAQVRTILSSQRLRSYLAAEGGRLVPACRLYAWNAEISAALHGPLGYLEIVIRNALHYRLADHFGRPDWWQASRLQLTPIERLKIDEVLKKDRSLSPDDVVAKLTFGVWIALLRKAYEMTLWRPALRHAFPQYRGPRSVLHQDLYNMGLLRNRIAHHEPVHHRHLAADHGTIVRLIGYVSTEAASLVTVASRVPAVLSRRTGVCDGTEPPSL